MEIIVFTTNYVINIARELMQLFNKNNIKSSLYNRKICESDVKFCNDNKDVFMFLFCAQWICPPHLLPLPKHKYFMYQLEQFDKSNSPHVMNNVVLNLMCGAKKIFDYSSVNMEYYKTIASGKFMEKTILLPPLVVEYSKISQEKSYDVLFIGCMSKRRMRILQKLQESGINVIVPQNCFGDNLKYYISKSKIFLNIRYSDSNILETCRINEAMLHTNTMIVSEEPGSTLEYELKEKYKKNVYFFKKIKNDYYELTNLIKIILKIYDANNHRKIDGTLINNNISKTILEAI